MIKNIIFDIGGVLAGPKSGHWFITPNFWTILNKQLVDETILTEALKKYLYLQTQEPNTEIEEQEMFTKYYYEVLKEINYPNCSIELASKISDDTVYKDEKFLFFDEVKATLEKLSTNYNLYIISNGWPSSLRVLKNKGIDKYFKKIYISSLYSTTKEERLFDVFISENPDILPEESLYIDDRRHILTKANEYRFNLLLMDKNNLYPDSRYKRIKNLTEIEEELK